jgi:hypothetical protein
MSRIDIKIDRLVLRGVDPADQHSFVNGLKNELSRILAAPATGIKSARSHRTPVLRVGRLSMDPGLGGARKLGGAIAGAIGKGIKS